MKIVRFDLNGRVLHWSHALLFIWLLLTGIDLFLSSKSLLGDPLIKMIHIYASIPFIMIPAILYSSGSAFMHKDIQELISLKSNELTGFSGILRNSHFKGKFNPVQKMNFLVTLLLITGLSLSGSVIWMKSLFSVSFVELNFLVHDLLAELSLIILSGHILFSLYYSESIRGIIFGKINEEWAKEHYPDWWLKTQ